MSDINPFSDDPGPKPAPPQREIGNREALRISREMAAAANAGRSSYTMGMLIVATLTCAAILGLCGTTLKAVMSDDSNRTDTIIMIVAGMVGGLFFGAVVGLLMRFNLQTAFLGGMLGGVIGAVTTPATQFADRSPTAALAAAAVIGPLMILAVSYLFARLSRRLGAHERAVQPTSPWEPVKGRLAADLPPPAEAAQTEEDESLVS